jgi:polar amino acid transport system substrate-binding protein
VLTDTLKVGTLIVTLALASGTAMLAARSASAQDSGAALFASDCARCHGDALEGGEGPPLAGPGNAIGTYKTAGALLQYAMENMPNDQPATLAPDEYSAIIGFILSKHGVTVPGGFNPENGAAIVLP